MRAVHELAKVALVLRDWLWSNRFSVVLVWWSGRRASRAKQRAPSQGGGREPPQSRCAGNL